jgi:AcrB/AcrD/AcrF family
MKSAARQVGITLPLIPTPEGSTFRTCRKLEKVFDPKTKDIFLPTAENIPPARRVLQSRRAQAATSPVAKNGILLLDADQRFRAEGYSPRESMIEAGERRLRPIMMTALATIAGMIPLSLAIGVGSQILQPLAIAVIGGIVASMVLSLIVTPAVHYFLAKK